ncbi:MAG: DUF1007 family protein [Magnetovibrionaceae bacterium]
MAKMTRFLSSLFAALVAFALAWGFAPKSATTHPHVFIDARATYLFDDQGRLSAIRQVWAFDDFFSVMLIDEFDEDQSGDFSQQELVRLREEAFNPVEEFSYFTHVDINGELVPVAGISTFGASIIRDQVVYSFTADLPEAVDPRLSAVSVGLYDPSYYIDVALAEQDPNRSEGKMPACRFEIGEDSLNPIYFGTVFPTVTRLDCPAG